VIASSNSIKVMYVGCSFILLVLSCVHVVALKQADPPPKESYRLCIGLVQIAERRGSNRKTAHQIIIIIIIIIIINLHVNTNVVVSPHSHIFR
jgi:hypothetical protein